MGEKEFTGSERAHSITCEACTMGTYIIHISLTIDEETICNNKDLSVKHAFTVYGASDVALSTNVPEFPSMEVWNSELEHLKVRHAKAEITKKASAYLREKVLLKK
jgi:hypothetical protein